MKIGNGFMQDFNGKVCQLFLEIAKSDSTVIKSFALSTFSRHTERSIKRENPPVILAAVLKPVCAVSCLQDIQSLPVWVAALGEDGFAQILRDMDHIFHQLRRIFEYIVVHAL